MKPEHYTEATTYETALFGAAILAPSMLDRLSELVSPASFHSTDIGAAFALLVDLNASGKPVADATLLTSELRKANLLDKLGGSAFIAQAVNASYAHNSEWYAAQVAEFSRLRQLEEIGRTLTDGTNNAKADSQSIREHVASQLEALEHNDSSELETLEGMINGAVDEITEARRRGIRLGLPSQIVRLDEATGGFFNGDLTVLAARPSIGKSAFAIELAERVARAGRQVLLVSLEMRDKQIAHRFLNRATGISVKQMQSGDITAAEEAELIEAKHDLRNLPLKSFATSSATVSRIRARARVLKAQTGVDLIIVDYLGLISYPGRLSTYERTTAISRELKQMAMHLDRPVLALAQLNREAAKATMPSLEHLRDSGAIEQDADNVWLLHRASRTDTDTKLIIAKQRQGCVGTIDLQFCAERMSFEDQPQYSEWSEC